MATSSRIECHAAVKCRPPFENSDSIHCNWVSCQNDNAFCMCSTYSIYIISILMG